MSEIRPYQQIAKETILNCLKTEQNVLLQAIMGAGKTYITVKIIQQLLIASPNLRVLILAHKQELVTQFKQTFEQFTTIHWRHIGISCAGLNQKNIAKQITIATIQTFVNQVDKYPGAGFFIIDEVHRVDINKETQYKKVIDALRVLKPQSRLMGLSATPSRLGHGFIYGKQCQKGSKNLFRKCHYKIKYAELKKLGFLVPLKGFVANHDTLSADLAGVTVKGDYQINELGEIMTKERHLQTAVEAVEKFAPDKKWICIFCCTIEHAKQLKELLGDRATIIHSQLTSLTRQNNMQSWLSGKTPIITSVNILTEGFDFPALECLVFARPTLSSSLWLQAVGRVLRISPGKKEGLLIDLTDNTSRFGTDLDNVNITIPKAVEDEIKEKQDMFKLCPLCEVEVHRALRECPECGFEWKASECIIAKALPQMKEVVFGKLPPVWFDIESCDVSIHASKKLGKKLGKLTIQYEETFYHYKKVFWFFCLPDFYSGFSIEMAKKKWEQVSNDVFPKNISEFQSAEWLEPIKVLVDINKKYPEILEVECKTPEKNFYDPEDHEDLAGIVKPAINVNYNNEDLPF